jgi:hypothetical protein
VRPVETFVKVNMDGITVGRKVDLNAYTSYETLMQALEEMFQPSYTGAQESLFFLLENIIRLCKRLKISSIHKEAKCENRNMGLANQLSS